MIIEDEEGDSGFMFVIQYDEEKKNIILHMSSKQGVTADQYLLCLCEFVEKYNNNVDELFAGGDDLIMEKH